MTTAAWDAPTSAVPAVTTRRRVRGLRMPALPSWPLVSQIGGALGALGGVYLEWGSAVTLIIGGVGAIAVGALREAGKI